MTPDKLRRNFLHSKKNSDTTSTDAKVDTEELAEQPANHLSSVSTASNVINLEVLAEHIAKRLPSEQTTSNIDLDELAKKINALSPKVTHNTKQHISSEECIATKAICTDKTQYKIESKVLDFKATASLFEEYNLVEVIISNFKALKTAKSIKKNKLAKQVVKDVLEEQQLDNEKDLLKIQIKQIDTALKNKLLNDAHCSTKQDLNAALKNITKESTEDLQGICQSETCFEDSDLIRNVCGALKYGGFFDDAD